ncbi:MAG TPA: MarR family transcriptional regulator [Thermoanaerobaculia bacterium]|jgi:DNA-binding MarR family transcriptional regulator|nr:MarR family transcriptional regulator [Thermoanaerobaculia bacterium]
MEDLSPLQREIRQGKPFRSQSQEVVVALLRTADLVRRIVGRVLEPYGITPQQYNVLRILRGAGEQGLPTLEIGERMIEQTPGITRLLDRLEAKKLVRRERCREDRRQVLCWLTAAGLGLVERLDEPIDSADAEAVAMLGTEEQEKLLRLLDAIRSRNL